MLKENFVRALNQISTLSLSKFSERSENLVGAARADLHMADLRRMLCSSSYGHGTLGGHRLAKQLDYIVFLHAFIASYSFLAKCIWGMKSI